MLKIISALIIILFTSANAKAESLIVNITNIHLLKGNIVIELMDEVAFDDDTKVEAKVIPVTENSLSYQFESIKAGEYALFVYQDLNENNEPDFSIFGPEEPIGVSNNVKFSLLPPSWDEVMFKLNSENNSVDIVLVQD